MWSADEGFSITQNILQTHPDLKIIFGQADGIAMGAAKAVEGAGLTAQVTIGGYDGDMSALEYLSKCEGPFVVTATQSTRRMGVLAVDSALAVAAGQEVPEMQVSEAVLTPCEKAGEFLANHP
jgi:ribose transport system substrate-binding protein